MLRSLTFGRPQDRADHAGLPAQGRDRAQHPQRAGRAGRDGSDRHLGRHGPPSAAGTGPAAPAGRQKHHRRRLRQGRRRQEHGRANLAVALAMEGAKVGLLDADITGPNIPLMLGVEGAPAATPWRQDRPARALRRQGHLDPVLRAGGPADRLARAARRRRHPAVPARRRLGRAGLPRHRPAAGHVGRAADAGPGSAHLAAHCSSPRRRTWQ